MKSSANGSARCAAIGRAGVVGAVVGRHDHVQKLVVVTVEVMLAEAVERAAFRFRRHARIPEVAAEHLVRALPALHHLHRPAHLFGQQIERHRILREHRLGHLLHRFRQAAQHLRIGDQVLVVAGAVHRRHRVGVFEFVAALFRLVLEADREGHQVRHALLGQQRHQQARIESAGEQHADLDVGNLDALLDRLAQAGMDRFGPFGLALRLRRAFGFQRPVFLVAEFAAHRHRQRGAGRQFADAVVEGARRRHHRMQGEQVVQRDGIDAGVDAARCQQGLRGRGEAEAAEVLAVIQGLDAEAVARQEQGLAVPDGEREHAVQAFDAGFAPLEIGAQDDFGIAVGMEMMAQRDQFAAQFRVVVDGAVEHQRRAGAGVDHRLARARRQVDDRQPPVAQPHRPVGMLAFGVGAAARQLRQHARHRHRIGWRVVEPEFPCYAAHGLFAVLECRC